MNLTHHYYYFKSAIPSRICDDIVKYGQQLQDQMAVTGGYGNFKKLNKTQIKDLKKKRDSNIVWMNDRWIYKEIQPYVHQANANAGWNFNWDFSESCQFTKYKKGQYYDWHCDSWDRPYQKEANDPSHGKIRKLSVTVTLSDPKDYKGGELEFDFRNLDPDKKPNIRKCTEILPKGSLVIFPSFVWHRVCPIKKGRKKQFSYLEFRISIQMSMTFPQELIREDYFKCPIWFADQPKFVNKLNKASDKYIKDSQKISKKAIDERNKKFGDKGDMGHVFHSTTLIGDPKFKDLQDYIGATAHNLLDEMGFDLSQYQVFTTEMWVQEFAKKGGGHHTLHTHWNGHISGFYFLKADESTSLPMFEDPRPGNVMNLLPEKDKTKITYASSQITYKVKPGRMIFFPSYMPHQYIVDMGYSPFRFIHWNCQAIPKGVLNVVQK